MSNRLIKQIAEDAKYKNAEGCKSAIAQINAVINEDLKLHDSDSNKVYVKDLKVRLNAYGVTNIVISEAIGCTATYFSMCMTGKDNKKFSQKLRGKIREYLTEIRK